MVESSSDEVCVGTEEIFDEVRAYTGRVQRLSGEKRIGIPVDTRLEPQHGTITFVLLRSVSLLRRAIGNLDLNFLLVPTTICTCGSLLVT